MKNELMECYWNFSNQVIEKMLDPDIYAVDFIPVALKNSEERPNIENYHHTQKVWIKLNKMLNRSLLGRHLGRPSKRPLLLHSFNSFETYHKTKKKKWIKVAPHLHSVLYVHPSIKSQFEKLLLVDLSQRMKNQFKKPGVETSTPYTIRQEVFLMDDGTDMNTLIQSLHFRIPDSLEHKVDYSFGLFENYKPINHPEQVFKDDIEEKMDGMGIFALPSEYDFKRKLREVPIWEMQRAGVS